MIENSLIFVLTAVIKALILLVGFALIVKEVFKYKVLPLFK
jgi:hypothetical protein